MRPDGLVLLTIPAKLLMRYGILETSFMKRVLPLPFSVISATLGSCERNFLPSQHSAGIGSPLGAPLC